MPSALQRDELVCDTAYTKLTSLLPTPLTLPLEGSADIPWRYGSELWKTFLEMSA